MARATCVGVCCCNEKKIRRTIKLVDDCERLSRAELFKQTELVFDNKTNFRMRREIKSHSPFVATIMFSGSPISRSGSFAVFSTAMVIFTAIIATFFKRFVRVGICL